MALERDAVEATTERLRTDEETLRNAFVAVSSKRAELLGGALQVESS